MIVSQEGNLPEKQFACIGVSEGVWIFILDSFLEVADSLGIRNVGPDGAGGVEIKNPIAKHEQFSHGDYWLSRRRRRILSLCD